MQTDKNDTKVQQSVSMHSHALERPCKRQIVTDPKSRNASHMQLVLQSINHSNTFDNSVSSIPFTTLLSKLFNFLLLEEGYVSAVTLSESTLMFGDNLIKVNIDLFKHIPYINFGENWKDTNGTIIFYIKSALIFMIGCNRKTPFFNSEGKFELNNELLKL